ncbi:hypothetical protein IC229_03980 [Spirosoma sp. BT702]|uniref:Uncharacterized protein n=1 Tax=Spirosoma profusum TaxID=2771354 RepID=A0A926XXJ4_9BACT|nr:hypothetical protein [Spirosoma profusum]MBD2699782.1 hypothetical protein [Spirosoma profusum]
MPTYHLLELVLRSKSTTCLYQFQSNFIQSHFEVTSNTENKSKRKMTQGFGRKDFQGMVDFGEAIG